MLNHIQHPFAEKRSTARLVLPKRTTAHLRTLKQHRNIFFVRDISENGMLICDIIPEKRFHLDSIFSDIHVNIPNKDGNGGLPAGSIVKSLSLGRGKVVRCSVDRSSSSNCYAVSFLHASVHIRRQISILVSDPLFADIS